MLNSFLNSYISIISARFGFLSPPAHLISEYIPVLGGLETRKQISYGAMYFVSVFLYKFATTYHSIYKTLCIVIIFYILFRIVALLECELCQQS